MWGPHDSVYGAGEEELTGPLRCGRQESGEEDDILEKALQPWSKEQCEDLYTYSQSTARVNNGPVAGSSLIVYL